MFWNDSFAVAQPQGPKLYVLPVSVWVSPRFSSFFPPPKNILVGGLAKLPLDINKCVHVCLPDLITYGWALQPVEAQVGY